jgi:hypothetical protein
LASQDRDRAVKMAFYLFNKCVFLKMGKQTEVIKSSSCLRKRSVKVSRSSPSGVEVRWNMNQALEEG